MWGRIMTLIAIRDELPFSTDGLFRRTKLGYRLGHIAAYGEYESNSARERSALNPAKYRRHFLLFPSLKIQKAVFDAWRM